MLSGGGAVILDKAAMTGRISAGGIGSFRVTRSSGLRLVKKCWRSHQMGQASYASVVDRQGAALGLKPLSKRPVKDVDVESSIQWDVWKSKNSAHTRNSSPGNWTSSSSSSRSSISSSMSRVAGPSTTIGQNTHVKEVRGVAFNFPSSPMPLREGTDEPSVKEQAERKQKKVKPIPAEAVLRRDLNMCSKEGDILRALEIYDQSAADKIVQWNQYNFNILLYLCSSAALGSITVRKSGTDRVEAERMKLQSVEQTLNDDFSRNNEESLNEDRSAQTSVIIVSPEVSELATTRGFEIFEEMKRQNVPPNEATLTAVARLAVRREDGDLAFQMVKEMGAMNIAPKLRSYTPAIVIFCKRKAIRRAFEVDAHMLAAGVQPEEPELSALLQLSVELQLEKEVYSLLHRIRGRVRALAPKTVASIQEWFSSPGGTAAGKKSQQPDSIAIQKAVEAGGGGWHGLGWLGKGNWKLEWTTIDSKGFCLCCKKKLATIDLDPKETENFAKSLSELAILRESKFNGFRRFQEWLEQHGPFSAIVDGANIGLHNQNSHQGGFSFLQLNAVAKTAQDQLLLNKPPLIILHQARTKFGAASSPKAQQLLQKWNSTNSLFTTPTGSNDDWYWLYAAVKQKCLLITNDEMRDHLFQLLGNDFFPRWKERHQVRFSSTSRAIMLHLPPPYSCVIQESEDGSWHIPKIVSTDLGSPHEWLCITRPVKLVNVKPKATRVKKGTHLTAIGMDISYIKDDVVSVLGPRSAQPQKNSVPPVRKKRTWVSSPSTALKK